MKCLEDKTEMQDQSFRKRPDEEHTPHFCCPKCGRRFHDGKWYTNDEWFFYTHEQIHQETLAMESEHAHEMINHSNPE